MPVLKQPGGVLCAVDVGTSAIRAAIVRPDGCIVKLARRHRDSGLASAVFEPERLWADVAATLLELTAGAGPERLRGLAVTAHTGTVVVDDQGKAVWDGFGWADDHGTDLLAAAWASQPQALTTVGRPVVTGGGLAALCWLRSQQPQAFRRARWLLSPKDLLLNRLTGAVVTDVTSAAYTLAFDIRAREWAPALCAAAGLDPVLLPPVFRAHHVVGSVSPAGARRTGLPPGLPVVAGGPDGTVGAAVLADPGNPAVVDIAGTTDVVTRITSGLPISPPSAALVNPYLTDDHYSCGGPTGMTGGAASFLGGLLHLGNSDNAMTRLGPQIEAIPPGSDGLQVIPTITGARFPRWDPAERGALTGLSADHTAAHVLRASHEAAAYVVRECADLLAADGERHGRRAPLVLAGGATRSAWLTQLRADVLGRTVLACAEPEIGLLGAAVLAAAGVGLYPTIAAARASMAPPLCEVAPDPDLARRFSRLYADWTAASRRGGT